MPQTMKKSNVFIDILKSFINNTPICNHGFLFTDE